MVADRHNNGKPLYSLLPLESLEGVVRVLEFGAKKYAKNQWKLGLTEESCLDSMMRHLSKELEGIKLDEESGLEHIDHMICNLLFIKWYRQNPKEVVTHTHADDYQY